MMHAGLDLSRRKIDVCLLSDEGELCGELAVPADADGLRAPESHGRWISASRSAA